MSNRCVLAFGRTVRLTDMLLLGSFAIKMFKQRIHVCHNTFKFLCEWFRSIFGKEKYTSNRDNFNWK